MEEAAAKMEFERAAMLRDQIYKLQGSEAKSFKYKSQVKKRSKKLRS
ncbi:MAG: UvrB/UvrC motif-containing protein [Lentisphaeria bacterium]